MTDRIDHAAEAAKLVGGDPRNGVVTIAQNAEAQVHATLALAEQQRIANLLAVAGWHLDSSPQTYGRVLDEVRFGLAGQIWEALGLLEGQHEEVFIVLAEDGEVVDVTRNKEWAEWLTREDDDVPLRTLVKETIWDGPADRAEWGE